MTTVEPPRPSPLEIEEVLFEIVIHLDRPSLYNCISLSKVFYRACVRALWTNIQWRTHAGAADFLPQFKRYGHYAFELQDNINADLVLIATICTNLRSLRLTWTPATDDSLARLLASSPKINWLHLHSCKALTQNALGIIAGLSKLRRLEIKNMTQIDEPSIVALLRATPCLEHLALEDVRLDQVVLDSLGVTPLHLKTLVLTRSYPTGSFVKNLLRNAPMLVDLSLARNKPTFLSQEDILPLKDSFQLISNLNLESCKLITSDALLALFHLCPSLLKVNMSATWIDDAGLDALALHCPLLYSLNLAFCMQVTDGGVSRLLRICSSLKFLNLSSHDTISSAIFQAPSWVCTHLETLIIVGINMGRPATNRRLNHASMFQQLSQLEHLQDLALGGSTVVLELDSGLPKLEALHRLRSFRIAQLQSGHLGDDEIRWFIGAWPQLRRAKFDTGSLPAPWLRYFATQRPQLVLN